MYAYKCVRSEVADIILQRESIRIGSLEYYREQDESDGVGDRFDGLYRGVISYEPFRKAQEFYESIGDGGYVVCNGYPVNMDKVGPPIISAKGAQVSCPSKSFVFCASIGTPVRLLSEWTQRNGMDGYDTVLKVINIEGLANAIWRCGVMVKDGKRVRSIFKKPRICPVTYDDSLDEISDIFHIDADPAKKREIYSWQREIRIVFDLDLDLYDYISYKGSFIDIKVGRIDRYIVRV